MNENYVEIGRILRPQANKGEVRIRSEADSPHAFLSFLKKRVFLAPGTDREPRLVQVEKSRIQKGFVIVKFEGTDDIDAAEKLRGASVLIPLEDRDPLPEGEYYLDQLIGLEVVEGERLLGKVRDVLNLSGNHLLEIEKSEGKTFLAPFVKEMIKRVDLEHGCILVSLPPGLEEITSHESQ